MSKVNWKIDASHSEVLFKVKHMMITNVTGHFTEIEGSIETEEEDFTTAMVDFKAKTASVNTNSEQRDTHLRSAEFFDADQFPTVNFKSTRVTKGAGNAYQMEGDLTLHGITKNINLQIEFGGINKDPWGQTKAGFTVNGKINRGDFGLVWNSVLETGGVLVSEEVRISAEVQLIRG